MRVLHDFHGGIHPPEQKALSQPGQLGDPELPMSLRLPLAQHIGAPAKAQVAVGDRVLGGQCLAIAEGSVSAAVHAPTSGTVTAIGPAVVPHPSGLADHCIEIAVDGEDAWLALAGRDDWREQDPEVLISVIRDAGIAGLGGAGFPTSVKLIAGSAKAIHTLLINGTECEPYITADDTLMQTDPRGVLEGAAILAHIVGAQQIVVGIEDNKPAAIAAVEEAAAGDWGVSVEVVSFPTKYPSGGEKQLIEILFGEQVPSGGLPADLGIVCQNPGTAVAVRDAVCLGKPLTHRIVTLTGEALSSPQNLRVRLGTPISWLLKHAGFDPTRSERVIHGGPMMGFALSDLDVPVIKTTNCVLAPTPAELPLTPPAQACIRCGLCADVCPASLLPQQLYWYARAKDHEQLTRHHLFDCIECGACAWVCPSHIPLVQYYRAAKGTLREAAAEKARSDNARERFEARQARVEREAAAREAQRAARKAAAAAKASVGGEDPVQAAIARAQARKAAQASEAGEDDPVKAAIARVQAKKAAQQGEQAAKQDKKAAQQAAEEDES